ncbi:FIG004453: protein YceG like [hydrothermal vent metagenome]|uniref:FIG004453: protein YceG like n=1 Tax=hydrothermal vent metagenome TaxID=652676 RepID=A0A3B0TIE1_9ZZZZ
MAIKNTNKIILFPKLGKYIIIFFSIAFILAGLRGYQLFQYIFKENVKSDLIIIIPENATFRQVVDSLKAKDALINYKAFMWVAKKKDYRESVKPGRFLFQKGMNTNELINILRIGKQEPVRVTFNNVRFKEEFAGVISRYLLADSASILQLFSDSSLIHELGFTKETFKAMFIPNTYEVYWTTSPVNFAKRMKIEYGRFWNNERLKKAGQLGLAPVEVSILASIVQEETIKKAEKPVVAGLYINRLKRGIPLQADPTLKFAIKDFTIKRVLNKHLETDSPYNTYLNTGLPPGPINFPEISSIEAVLNYKKHNYLYMCAKEDFSGYHNFSSTLAEHNRNARRYRNALDSNRVWK